MKVRINLSFHFIYDMISSRHRLSGGHSGKDHFHSFMAWDLVAKKFWGGGGAFNLVAFLAFLYRIKFKLNIWGSIDDPSLVYIINL